MWIGLFFFFKQKTAYEMRISDWSSDVCSSDLRGFGLELHREVRIVPIAHHAQPLELGALHRDPFFGIGAAFGAELGDGHLILVLLLRAIGFLDLPFDRPAVAIPAGHVRPVPAPQRTAADDRKGRGASRERRWQ